MRTRIARIVLVCAAACFAQAPPAKPGPDPAYTLGPEDQLAIWVLGFPEIDKPVRVSPEGFVDVPMFGRLPAGGLTLARFKDELKKRADEYVKEPEVSVNLIEAHSRPVSVIGAVQRPGEYQVVGGKTLIQALSLAGGLREDAGNLLKITRRVEYGPIPLPAAALDPTSRFSTAEIKLASLVHADNPAENIALCPYDVVSVPKAEMVYVVGEVTKPGGFVLSQPRAFSVLQAVSLAGGVLRTAAPQNAKVLRTEEGKEERSEIPVNVKRILAGQDSDVTLRPDDILFVPGSAVKNVSVRAIETAIQIGTGVVIWRK